MRIRQPRPMSRCPVISESGLIQNDTIRAMSQPDAPRTVRPLTVLSEDEQLLAESVRAFTETVVAPEVRTMDAEAHIPRALIDQLFALGVMGIEVPESLGGSGGTFFHAIVVVEALSRVDPSIAVLVDVQ